MGSRVESFPGSTHQVGCRGAAPSCDQKYPCPTVGSACDRKEHYAAAVEKKTVAESTELKPSERVGKGSCGWRGRKMGTGEFAECEPSRQTQPGKQCLKTHRMGLGDVGLVPEEKACCTCQLKAQE